jgi:hypothetical protein
MKIAPHVCCLFISMAMGIIGCSAPPDLAPLPSRTGQAPELVPLGTLMATVDAPRATDALAANLASRAALLRNRAALMRGPVIDPATRARLAAAIARGRA